MKNYFPFIRNAALLVVLCVIGGCKTDSITPVTSTPDPGNGNTPITSPFPKTPGTITAPASNPVTDPRFAARVELGRHLFYDAALSVDGSTSCATCHNPGIGFADPRAEATSIGFRNRQGTRNAPALANIGYYTAIAWDGKFNTLEDHALAPIFNNIEMGNNFSASGNDPISTGYYHSDPGANDTLFLFARLDGGITRNHGIVDPSSNKKDKLGKNYYAMLQAAWGTDTLSLAIIQKSIACFERTFTSTQSTFDKFNRDLDVSIFKYNPEALHGFRLFTDTTKANCVGCHNGYNFTDQKFHSNGLNIVKASITNTFDSGRALISKDPADAFKFRTPGLRNVALTGPYMHDGRFNTLEQVLTFYNNGGDNNVTIKDSKIKPLHLSDQDMADIIEFLKTLTDPQFTINSTYSSPWK